MKIISSVVNNPIFIEIQLKTLTKYFQGDFEFIIFNDAKDFPDYTNNHTINTKQIIRETCYKVKVRCIDIPNAHQRTILNSSFRTAEALNFILEFQKKNPDQYLIIDSDMFLIDDFSPSIFESYDCAIVLQNRNHFFYCWNGIYYFDSRNLKLDLMNWHCTINTDTGGEMNKWIHSIIDDFTDIYSKISYKNILFIPHKKSFSWNNTDEIKNHKLRLFIEEDPRNKDGTFYSELYFNSFFHYRGGGNWERKNMNEHLKLSLKLKEALI
jgi:hypothetical protein